jgi:hypothetical protein
MNPAAIRAGVAAVLLAAGIATVHGLEAAMHATFDKPPAPLRKEFPLIKKELGWPVHYRAADADEILDEETVETLGTEQYLVRRYEDATVPPGAPGAAVNLNVNYYATGSSSPHVPEVCWKGNGREEAGSGITRQTFDVTGIKRRDGSTVDVRMRMISFMPLPGRPTQNDKGEPIYSNVAYVFHVNGDYVTSPHEVTSHFWKAAYKYAYHAKIEITPMGVHPTGPGGPMVMDVLDCTQAEAKKIVSDFMREALPAVEECLPDPSILTQNEPSN